MRKIILFIVLLSFVLSCSKSINDKDLVGTWKTEDGKSIILYSDYTFVGKNIDSTYNMNKGKWYTEWNRGMSSNSLRLDNGKYVELLTIEDSFFHKSIILAKWIGDPDDYNRDEYEKIN